MSSLEQTHHLGTRLPPCHDASANVTIHGLQNTLVILLEFQIKLLLCPGYTPSSGRNQRGRSWQLSRYPWLFRRRQGRLQLWVLQRPRPKEICLERKDPVLPLYVLFTLKSPTAANPQVCFALCLCCPFPRPHCGAGQPVLPCRREVFLGTHEKGEEEGSAGTCHPEDEGS